MIIEKNEFVLRNKVESILIENEQISFEEVIVTLLEEDLLFDDFELVEKICTEYGI